MTVETSTDSPADWIDADPGSTWQFVCRGAYQYGVAPAGESSLRPTGIVERFTECVSLDGHVRRTRAIRDARDTPANVLLRVETWRRRDDYTALEFTLIGTPKVVRVRYEVEDGRLVIRGQDGDLPRPPEHLDLPEGALLLPLTRDHLGPLIVALAGRPEGRGTVVVPDLRNPTGPDLFAPLVSARTATVAHDPPRAMKAAGRRWSAVPYGFEGGPYDHSARFWVDDRTQRLIRYGFTVASGERWSAELVHFESSSP